MGWIFKRKVRPSAGAGGEAEHSAQAKRIADRIIRVQQGLAEKLNARAQKIGLGRTKFLLGAVLLGFACYCAWLMVSAIF